MAFGEVHAKTCASDGKITHCDTIKLRETHNNNQY